MNTNDVKSFLSAERTLKKFFKDADYLFLDTLNKRILSALADKKAEHDEQERLRRERDEKRNELMVLIASEGFSLSDLIGGEAPKSSQKRKRKYVYMEGGIEKYWSGVGRTPHPIQEGLDTGKTLDSFLIPAV